MTRANYTEYWIIASGLTGIVVMILTGVLL